MSSSRAKGLSGYFMKGRFILGNERLYALNRRLCGPQSRSERYRIGKMPFSTEIRSPGCSVKSLVDNAFGVCHDTANGRNDDDW